MKAAISSCRACTNSILPSARCSAPKTIVMPSPDSHDAPHTPLVKSLDKEIADGLAMGVVSAP
jgi:hypothetical protein